MSADRKALTSAFRRGALVVAALLGASPASADAVSVSDSGSSRVQVDAHDASLGQILAALHESHLIEFSASDPLSRTVTGTNTGTLSQVRGAMTGLDARLLQDDLRLIVERPPLVPDKHRPIQAPWRWPSRRG